MSKGVVVGDWADEYLYENYLLNSPNWSYVMIVPSC